MGLKYHKYCRIYCIRFKFTGSDKSERNGKEAKWLCFLKNTFLSVKSTTGPAAAA